MIQNTTFPMIQLSLYIKEYKGKVLQIFFIFQQLKYQISPIDQNGVNSFCDETLEMFFP